MGNEKMEMGNKKQWDQCHEEFYRKKRKQHVDLSKSQVREKKEQSHHQFATSDYKNTTKKLFQQVLLKCEVTLLIISGHPRYFPISNKFKSFVKTVPKPENSTNPSETTFNKNIHVFLLNNLELSLDTFSSIFNQIVYRDVFQFIKSIYDQ